MCERNNFERIIILGDGRNFRRYTPRKCRTTVAVPFPRRKKKEISASRRGPLRVFQWEKYILEGPLYRRRETKTELVTCAMSHVTRNCQKITRMGGYIPVRKVAAMVCLVTLFRGYTQTSLSFANASIFPSAGTKSSQLRCTVLIYIYIYIGELLQLVTCY